MKRLRIMTLALASVGLATAQNIPPLEPLRGDAANLKDTMKFIQDKLPGAVNYVVYAHNNVTGVDSSKKRIFEIVDVTADPGTCSIRFHSNFDNGDKAIRKDNEIFLKPIQTVALQQMDQVIQQGNAKIGRPEVSIRVEPTIFLAVLSWEPSHRMMFNFYDDTLADRVTKALQHAVDLCGGGNKDPF
jgi:hypothetical protein